MLIKHGFAANSFETNTSTKPAATKAGVTGTATTTTTTAKTSTTTVASQSRTTPQVASQSTTTPQATTPQSTTAPLRSTVNIAFRVNNFEVRLANSIQDLDKVFALRHSVFYEEWLGESHPTGTDKDEFDTQADHLMIIDKNLNEAVATYRILCSHWANRFYSQCEFDLSQLLKLPGTNVEVGRACVKPDYRSGLGIDLLWRGLAQYLLKVRADRIFGCASVLTDSTALVENLINHLRKKDSWSDDYNIRPTETYAKGPEELQRMANETLVTSPASQIIQALPQLEIPPLLRGYLLAGAKVYGQPAYDADFACFDLFTKLEVKDINLGFLRRYFRNDNAEVSCT